MDNFIVSARKYRPSTFNSVVGQLALTTTLKNAIKSKQLAHAYLFCGPRGVGKTTCARIFAKTINCEHLTDDFEACNSCESCVSFNEQRSYNIHELDAASNNSVDDIRSLIEQVRIPPQIGKYSVYIVDEVHMLSPGAFNAFLKTLEEPPAHALFILATTEKHKIIPTILSRCQIYDFNRITVADTVAHLQYVAQSEGVSVDVNGLNVIAHKSDGGMRDALSIFDQLVSFCGNEISYQGVIDNLNVLDYEYYFKLLKAFLEGDVNESLVVFNDVLNKGFDAHHFITGLSSHLRDVLVSKDSKTLHLLEVGNDIAKRYQVQAQACSPEFIFQALKISNDCDLNYRISKNKRLLVEIALIRMCQLNDQKKKDLLIDEKPLPLQKVSVGPSQAENNSTVTESPTTSPTTKPNTQETKQAAANETVAKASVQASAQAIRPNKPSIGAKRPASISINKPTAANTEKVNEASSDYNKRSENLLQNEKFSSDKLIAGWRAFANSIEDDGKRVGFENTNLPELKTESEFEVLVNNVMQESELKRIQTDLVQFLIGYLKNSNIKMHIRVKAESEVQRSTSPEEEYKIFAEQNPVLEMLRKNLQLEID